MLEQIGEPLGPDGGLERTGGADIACDQSELTLDGRCEAPRAVVDQGIEPGDRTVEPLDGLRQWAFASAAVVVERDDLCHTRTIRPGSDMAGTLERRARCDQATRTLVTGASRSRTRNHEPPASAEPNTSPLVAPKYSSWLCACPVDPKA